MVSLRKEEHILISFYNPGGHDELVKKLSQRLLGTSIRILTPNDNYTLEQAAQNSALIIMPLSQEEDPVIELCAKLRKNRLISADIIALDQYHPDNNGEFLDVIAMGFDDCISVKRLDHPHFKDYLTSKIHKGADRLKQVVRDEEHRRLRLALSSATVSIVVLDNERRVVFISDHYHRAYPDKAHSFLRGMSIYALFDLIAEEEGIEAGSETYLEIRDFIHKVQDSLEIELGSGTIYRLRGVHLPGQRGFVITGQNITDYIKQQRSLEEKSAQLHEALDQERDAREIQQQFIDMISHEFRTPLAIIDGNAQIMSRKQPDIAAEEIEERCQTILSGVARLSQMMDAVLSSNMLKTGQLEVYKDEIDLDHLISTLIRDQQSYQDNVDITYSAGDGLKKVKLDQKLTTLILSNILVNAIKYSQPYPVVQIRAKNKNKEIVIEIEDNGPGVDKSEIDKIFERFYRGRRASKKPGTGLGLSLARELAGLQNGSIYVHNVENSGACFKIVFPIE